jgi:hypothetical protein
LTPLLTKPVERKENAAAGYFYWFVMLGTQLLLATTLNEIYLLNPKL